MLVPGYKIDSELHSDMKSVVLEAVRESDGISVIIKTLPGDYPDPRSLARIRHEYSLAKELSHSGIVHPIELINFNDRLAIIYEDFGGIPLSTYILDANPTLKEKIQIAIDLADIVGHIHNENVIHKDINPGNIIINPEIMRVKIIDFGISTKMEREIQETISTNQLEGSLSYISPEQTGRMNRSIDYRSDIYSLGVTLYELFTSKLPFYGDDSIEIIYGHIAKTPVKPSRMISSMPEVLSEIIMRCLAKKSEERYQSAFGLKKDLNLCLDQIDDNGNISPFPLGKFDISSKFKLSQRLYGRDDSVNELISSFRQVQGHSTVLLLVAGYSGIGKSSVINELQKTIIEKRSLFLKGKFDQFKRDTPYSAIIQAFSELINQILTDEEKVVASWQIRLRNLLADEGKVVTSVLPEVEHIIGEQKDLMRLDPDDEAKRFYRVFGRFIQEFATAEKPLVISLDDLQWADSGTLDLLKHIILEKSVQHLMIIGAYRSNEVDVVHPLSKLMSLCRERYANMREIELKPLNQNHILELVADSLICSQEEALTLSKLIYSKTQGNPFFTGQLLRNVYDEGLLRFDLSSGRWVWKIDEIRSKNISDNVISLMEDKLNKLPHECLYYIQIASCLGSRFSIEILSLVVRKPRSHVISTIISAIHEGFILSPSFDYRAIIEQEKLGLVEDQDHEKQHFLRFVHDRIQQAAYQPIPRKKKQEYRLTIGRLLFERYRKNQHSFSEHSFEIVSHLNEGLILVTDPNELRLISELNVNAGIKAKESAAFSHALEFFYKGIQALGANAWKKDYLEISFQLFYQCAETHYLARDHDNLEKMAIKILGKISDPTWKAQVYMLMMNLRLYQSRIHDAFNVGLRCLGFLDIPVPVGKKIYPAITVELLKARMNYSALIQNDHKIPTITGDLKVNLTSKVLVDTFAISQEVDHNTTGYLILKIFNMSFEEGFTEYSLVGYLGASQIMKTAFGSWSILNRLSDVALRRMEHFEFVRPKSQFYSLYGFTIAVWFKKPQECLLYLEKGLAGAYETGNILWEAFSSSMMSMHMHCCDAPLLEHLRSIEETGEFAKKANTAETQVCYRSNLEFVSAMMGLSVKTEPLKQVDYLPWERQVTVYCQNKLKQYYLLEKCESAWYVFFHNLGKFCHDPNFFPAAPIIEFYFYLGLVLIQIQQSGIGDKKIVSKWINKSFSYFRKWSKSSPDACLGKYLMLKAERSRMRGELEASLSLLEQVISWAAERDLTVINGLANESIGKIYLRKMKPKIARTFILESRFLFEKWGGKAKVSLIDKNYRELLVQFKLVSSSMEGIREKDETSSTMFSKDQFDINTVIKFSRAVASEIRIADLLKKIMSFIIENAGAEKGCLILVKSGQDEELFIEVSGQADQEMSLLHDSIPLSKSQSLSHAVVYYVYRTKKTLVIDDASASYQFKQDPYIRTHQTKSVLCSPILHQGKLIGIIYLENNLISEAFVGDRTQILDVLASQTAVSLENAMLYADMEEKIKTRTRELKEKTQDIADILTNIDQVIFTMNQDLSLNPERSGMADRCFPYYDDAVSGDGIGQLLNMNLETRQDFKKWTDLLFKEKNLKRWEKLKLLNPVSRFGYQLEKRSRQLELDFQPIAENGRLAKIMVLGRDITDKINMEEVLQYTRKDHELQMERVMSLVWQDREMVFSLLDDCKEKMTKFSGLVDVNALSSMVEEAFRDLHTLKGNAGSFGLNYLAGLLDRAEDFIQKVSWSAGDKDISNQFAHWTGLVRDILEETENILAVKSQIFGRGDTFLAIPKSLYEKFLSQASGKEAWDAEDIHRELVHLNSFPLKELARKYQNIISQFRKESGLNIQRLKVDPESYLIQKDLFQLFDVALVHLIRNALSHGFLYPEDGSLKPPGKAQISLACLNGSDHQIIFEVSDNGRGLDTEKIRAKAIENKVIDQNQVLNRDEIFQLIFQPGFTTKSESDYFSGRGVGMDVVKRHLESYGGGVRLESKAGQGTKITIWLPDDAHLREGSRSGPKESVDIA